MDNTQNPAPGTAPAAPAKKTKKPKGPIRFEAIVPFLIFMGLVIVYFILFFDTHLRKTLEWGGTYLNGAEVNIADVDTSFWKASLSIRDIQVTNRKKPTHNSVELGEIRFGMLWDALLRAKVVIPDAGITDIRVGSQRKRPGKVYEFESRSAALATVRESLSDTVLGDIARLLDGFDPTKDLKDLANLKSAARIQELKKELGTKMDSWNNALASIPGGKDFDQIQAKLQAINVGGSKNPAEIQAQISQVNGLIQEINQKVSTVEKQSSQLSGDVNGFGTSVGQIDDLARQDRQDLESRLKLPKIDPKSMAMEMFGGQFADQLAQVEHYKEMAREYIPPKATSTVKPVEPIHKPKRDKGKNYQFGRPNSYPQFWLKHAVISSRAEGSEFGGNLKGEARDFTSAPEYLGRPAVVSVQGDFPAQNIRGVDARVEIDHVGENPTERFKIKVAEFPLTGRMLSESDTVKFGFAKALGGAEIEGSLAGDQISFGAKTLLRDVDYTISATSKLLEQTLSGVVKGIPQVNIAAMAKGSWKDLDLSISSNLASELASGFQRHLQAKIAESRQKIQAMIDSKISAGKAELTGQYQAARGKVMGQVEEKKKKAEELKGMANAKLEALKKQATGGALEKINPLKKKRF